MVNPTDTRSKILCIASELFGRNGFDGVSIRDIAQAADVNVASINYHFTNKNKLFQEVFLASHSWLENEIAQFAKQPGVTVSKLTWSTFNMFLENGPMLLNTFRIFLSDQLSIPEELHQEHQTDGPPGSETFLHILTLELGDHIPLEKRIWAVRSIFCHIFHLGMIVNTAVTKKGTCMHQDWMKKEMLVTDINEIVEAVTMLLKSKYDAQIDKA